MRSGLLAEILSMAVETLRANKLRSFSDDRGVVIGVTSIVAMTALIRGFGDQMQQLIRQMGADTVYVAKMSIASFAAGREFFDLLKRPELTEDDAKAIRIGAPSVATVGVQLGGGPDTEMQRITYRDQSTKLMPIIGADRELRRDELHRDRERPVLHRLRSQPPTQRRRARLCARRHAVFDDRPGRQARPRRLDEYTVVGDDGQAAEPAHRQPGRVRGHSGDDLREGYDPPRIRGILARFLVIAVVPRAGVPRDQLIREIEQVMRSRHRLKLDEENDFDILTRISSRRSSVRSRRRSCSRWSSSPRLR